MPSGLCNLQPSLFLRPAWSKPFAETVKISRGIFAYSFRLTRPVSQSGPGSGWRGADGPMVGVKGGWVGPTREEALAADVSPAVPRVVAVAGKAQSRAGRGAGVTATAPMDAK